jgi:hypothetical protein
VNKTMEDTLLTVKRYEAARFLQILTQYSIIK